MGRSSACKNSVTPPPLVPVTHQPQYSGDRRRHGSKERVYGKTSRRKEIAKLRGIVINAGHRECKSIPERKYILFHDGLAKQAAKHHLYAPDSSRSLKPRIPPESQIMSMLRHDVGAVRGSDKRLYCSGSYV